MRLCAAAALLAAAGFSVQSAWAAELGTLSVSSRLNEPLEAKLTINQVTDASQPLVLRLASDAVYAKVGRQPLPADLGVKLTLASRNPWVVTVTSAKPITEEDMPLIIEMSEAGKLSAKFYRVKLEPAKTVAKPAAQKTAAATTAKTALKLPSAQTAAPALPSAEKTVATAKSAVKKTPATPVKAAEKPVAATKAAPKAAAQATSDDLYGLGDLSRPVTVKSGMTMWSIAKMYQPRYEGARTEEVLVALVRANPKAFEGGRVTGVKKGARLVPPSEKAVKSVGADTAWCLVHVTPNADARKAPSAAAMAKAHARMDKLGLTYEKTPAAKSVAKPAAAVKSLADSDKIDKLVKSVAPTEPAAKPVVEPVAPAIEPPSAPVPTPASAPVAAPEPQAPAAPVEKAEEKPAMTVTTTTNIRDEDIPKAAEKSGSGWLWGLLLAVVAAAGAGFFVWRRRKESARVEEARTVSFLRPEPTTPEQMKGMDTLFANRVAADAAAEKGFGVKNGATAVPQPTARVQAQPDPMSQAAVQAPKVAAPYTPAPTPSMQPLGEPEAEEPKPFTIRSTAEGMQFELEQPDQTLAVQKLEAARAKIGAGLPDEAAPLLQDVILTGSAEQKAAAERLLDTVKRV